VVGSTDTSGPRGNTASSAAKHWLWRQKTFVRLDRNAPEVAEDQRNRLPDDHGAIRSESQQLPRWH
jgi:hypothetical protein